MILAPAPLTRARTARGWRERRGGIIDDRRGDRRLRRRRLCASSRCLQWWLGTGVAGGPLRRGIRRYHRRSDSGTSCTGAPPPRVVSATGLRGRLASGFALGAAPSSAASSEVAVGVRPHRRPTVRQRLRSPSDRNRECSPASVISCALRSMRLAGGCGQGVVLLALVEMSSLFGAPSGTSLSRLAGAARSAPRPGLRVGLSAGRHQGENGPMGPR